MPLYLLKVESGSLVLTAYRISSHAMIITIWLLLLLLTALCCELSHVARISECFDMRGDLQ